ncbi:MAG: energy transducer TonB [Flavicella sp.]
MSKIQSHYSNKNFNEKLEKSSRLFSLLGLVLSLFIVHVVLNHTVVKASPKALSTEVYDEDDILEFSNAFKKEEPLLKVIEKPFEPKEVPPQRVKVPFLDVFKKSVTEPAIENDIPKIEITSLLNVITEIEEPEDIVEDVPFVAVEYAPVFPGCVGNATRLKDCFESRIRRHVQKHFNAYLASDLGLSSGLKKIHVQFTIDSKGEISDIVVGAPHPRLETEAKRLTKLLPKMKPGRQGSKNIGVRYSLPITFQVL